MSISSALQTGVSGLRANSKAVGSISENIANSNTVGYRRGFAHMVTTTASGGNGDGVLSVNEFFTFSLYNTLFEHGVA